VLTFVSETGRSGNDFVALQKEVEDDLGPTAILCGLRESDYRWATWRAGLRPHKDLVPTLLAGLEYKPEYRPETILALGQSRDKRALDPLFGLLKSGDYRAAGDAAQALGYLGDPEAEPKLIEALSLQGWPQLNACGALAKLGTDAAVPALKKLAESNEYTGALAVNHMARVAIESIARRRNR
jgi:HEAT repeat protein